LGPYEPFELTFLHWQGYTAKFKALHCLFNENKDLISSLVEGVYTVTDLVTLSPDVSWMCGVCWFLCHTLLWFSQLLAGEESNRRKEEFEKMMYELL
jgi:hypothetical protein